MHPNLRPGEDIQHFLERQASEMQTKAAALTEAFAESAATVSSRDGSVTVTVAPNGALRNLQLGHRACELGPARLTAAIMDTVRLAQKQTARSVAESLEIIDGPGEATDMVKSFLPPEEGEADPNAEQNKFVEEPEPVEEAPPPPAPPAPPPRPSAGKRPEHEEDDDDGGRPW